MKPSKSGSRRPERRRGTTLRVTAYPTVELLQRVEEAMSKSGLSSSRSALICQLFDTFAAARGC